MILLRRAISVECTTKQQIPDSKGSGMDYFKSILRGSHLLAHTWAMRPIPHGVFFRCSGIENAPSHE